MLNECQKSIENVTNLQVEFWVQVTNQLPDLNVLYELSNNIYKSTSCVESIWLKIYEINSNYNKALLTYGNYMLEIRNHYQAANEILEK